jgi:hypothetical protein
MMHTTKSVLVSYLKRSGFHSLGGGRQSPWQAWNLTKLDDHDNVPLDIRRFIFNQRAGLVATPSR